MFREHTQFYCGPVSAPVPLDELKLMMDKNREPKATPAGLVFHMSRCGSTLVANSASRAHK